jgi:ribosomal protein S18 acetylase RimI-like enzyme
MPILRPMQIDDHDAVIALMQATPGVTLRDADSRENTARYLERNPGLSLVAVADHGIVGCIMCGHDGRRGYLQHLLVHPDFRGQGIGAALVEDTLAALARIGIFKSHIDVLKTNADGAAWWARRGWTLRTDIERYSLIRSGGGNV